MMKFKYLLFAILFLLSINLVHADTLYSAYSTVRPSTLAPANSGLFGWEFQNIFNSTIGIKGFNISDEVPYVYVYNTTPCGNLISNTQIQNASCTIGFCNLTITINLTNSSCLVVMFGLNTSGTYKQNYSAITYTVSNQGIKWISRWKDDSNPYNTPLALGGNYIESGYSVNYINYTDIIDNSTPSIQYNTTFSTSQNNLATNVNNLTINASEQSNATITANSSMILSYNINTSMNNGCGVITEGNCTFDNTYQNTTMTKYNNSYFTKTLYDNSIFPAYYPFSYTFIDNTPHSNYTVYSDHNILFKVLNFSTVLNYTLNMEFNGINLSNGSSALLIYYCNSSYYSGGGGNPSLRNSCELIDSITTQKYDHYHNNSKHVVIPVVISTVVKTQLSEFVFVGQSNALNGWNFEYTTNSSYDNNSFEEGNFNLFNASATHTNKIFDMHLHPFLSTDRFQYYTTFNDNGNISTSSLQYLFYNISYRNPSGVLFNTPNCSAQYTLGSSNSINVSWTNASSQLNYPISYGLYYTLSDIPIGLIYNGTVNNFSWNSTSWNSLLSNGNYGLSLNIYDTINTTNSYLGCTFNICSNNWVSNYSVCVNNAQTITYTDSNNCNEALSIPSNNGSSVSCLSPASRIIVSLDYNLLLHIILILLIILSIYISKNGIGIFKFAYIFTGILLIFESILLFSLRTESSLTATTIHLYTTFSSIFMILGILIIIIGLVDYFNNS